MSEARALVGAPRRELAALMASGHGFAAEAIAGYVYRGISLGLPAWIERLTWKKFAKAFRRDPDTGRIAGWNLRIVQDGLDRPWRPMQKRGAPVTFGHFAVVPGARGVLLDYGAGGGLFRALRDPLVALRQGSVELLLGRSLVDVGVGTLGTPSYFVLERDHEL